MKKIIGTLVGALILFIWQFLSYGPLNVHTKQMDYTPAQDELLAAIEKSGIPPGEYFLPRTPIDMPSAVAHKARAKTVGKPWAMIQYHSELKDQMVPNLIRGFVIDFLAVYILCWILLQFADLSVSRAIMTSVGAGLIGYFTINYLNHIWFETTSLPYLLDAIVPWTAIGAWLGWWLRR